MDDLTSLDTEVELIQSSLLPAEHLASSDDGRRVIEITSDDSPLSLQTSIGGDYPSKTSVHIEVKSANMGREEAEEWNEWSRQKVDEWDTEEEYPLFQMLTAHFLPLLAPSSAPASPQTEPAKPLPVSEDTTPHHVLLTSHHLIAPSKRKDLVSLSSQLSLVGFAKTGHPGVIYAIGQKSNLTEWVREVKSWQWLALRVRITPEPIEGESFSGKGQESGARGGKGRGEWVELEKVGEAVEWLRKRGRAELLTDFGIGVGSDKA